MSSIGENIKKARISAGLTQKELAEKLGIKAATISAFEKDRTNIKSLTVSKIANALNIDVIELYRTDTFNNNVTLTLKRYEELLKKEKAFDEIVAIYEDCRKDEEND